MEGFISFLAPRRPDRAGPSLGYLLLAAIALFSSGSGATVYTGVDTLAIYDYKGLDFSERTHVLEEYSDLYFYQIQDGNTVTTEPAVLIANHGLRDLGAVPFDSLTSVPDTLGPDPGLGRRSDTGDISRWVVWLVEGHLYLVWTQEGHLAKVLVEEIISASDVREDLPANLWDQFIVFVVFRWAYQDDGSRSFEAETAVPATSWGNLKRFSKEKPR